MRSKTEIERLAKLLRELATFGEREHLRGETLTQSQTLRKIAEALEWATGTQNSFATVVASMLDNQRNN